jgi:hypothetical protein
VLGSVKAKGNAHGVFYSPGFKGITFRANIEGPTVSIVGFIENSLCFPRG